MVLVGGIGFLFGVCCWVIVGISVFGRGVLVISEVECRFVGRVEVLVRFGVVESSFFYF